MAVRVLPEGRDDLREALRYYRNVKPSALGKQLAARMLFAFKQAVVLISESPLGHPEHPDIPGARYVMLQRFPYLVFYTVVGSDSFIVAVEYATRDYVDRISTRAQRSK